MNWLRNALIGAILVVSFLLLVQWNKFQEQRAQIALGERQASPTLASDELAVNDIAEPASPASEIADLPSLSDPQADKAEEPLGALAASNNLIRVDTDALEVLIDPRGGDIVHLALPKYLAQLDKQDVPFTLLDRTNTHTYVAQSGLVGPNGTDSAAGRPLFASKQSSYRLSDSGDTLQVDLTLQQQGVSITKRFTFSRDSYQIGISYLIDNQGDSPWSAAEYGQIRRDSYQPPSDVGIGISPFVGAAITTPETHYKKLSFKNLEKDATKVDQQGGWVAMIQRYFMSAWVPNPEASYQYHLRKSQGRDLYILEYRGALTTVAAHSRGEIHTSFYAGPKIIKNLESTAPYLDLTIDFSWLWFIAKPLHFALLYIQSHVSNWGIAIILLTCLVKLVFYYPSAMSYRSMAKMRKLMPMMQELKERYGDDRQRIGVETMKLYKKEKVNPLGGCLPMLLQMPVFISLYWTIMESVELRHSPFFLWIADLSVRDPYFVLPLIMGGTMFIQQKLNPAPQDPIQAKVMQLMPIFFTAMFMMFPAGLVLYWVTNNTLSIAQQYVITKQIENS